MQGENELAALSASALVNLCNFSNDIKEIFFQKNGLNVLLQYLPSKKEEILINVLLLIRCFTENSETFTKQIASENEFEAVKILLKILLGPGLPNTYFSIRIKYQVLRILWKMSKDSKDAKTMVMKN